MNVELIKKAYQLGYRHGLKKHAAQISAAPVPPKDGSPSARIGTWGDMMPGEKGRLGDLLYNDRATGYDYTLPNNYFRQLLSNGTGVPTAEMEFGQEPAQARNNMSVSLVSSEISPLSLFRSRFNPRTGTISDNVSDPDSKREISQRELLSGRQNAARFWASQFAPLGTPAYDALAGSLERAGEENYRSYLETGTPKLRESTDFKQEGLDKYKPGFDEIYNRMKSNKSTPEDKSTFDEFWTRLRNTMASAPAGRRNTNVPYRGTATA